MKTITICSSANFYKQAVETQEFLEKKGCKVIIPSTAEKMKASGDYDASHYRIYHESSRYGIFTPVLNGGVAQLVRAQDS